MRAITEGHRLTVDAAALWWRRLPQLLFVFSAGFALHLLGINLSVRLGSGHQIAATLVFVLAVLAQVGALVIMLWLGRPAADHESALDVAAVAIGPFLAVYALWGLVDDEVYALFAANIAVSGIGGPDEWSVNLQWLPFYVVLAVSAWVARQAIGMLSRRRRSRLLHLTGVVLEGTWTFASALALLAGIGKVLDWVVSRTVWQLLARTWYRFLDALPEIRLPFDLTLPEALHQVVAWVLRTLVPAAWTAVLLPLMWLALTTVVFGWRALDARTAAGSVIQTAPLRGRERSGHRWVDLLRQAGLLLSADLRTKYLPVVRAFRLLWATGPPFLAAYLVLATAVDAARRWVELGIARVIGPRDPYTALAWSWAPDLAVGCVFTTAAVALYAAAGRRALTPPQLSEDAAPAPDAANHRPAEAAP